MLTYLVFIISYLSFAFAAACTAKGLYIITQRGEIFGRWQNVIERINPRTKAKHSFFREFIYKRLGGCITCMRQTVSELTFIVWVLMWPFDLPTHWIDNVLLEWTVNVLLFISFSFISLVFGQLIEYEKRQAQVAEEFIDAKIKR